MNKKGFSDLLIIIIILVLLFFAWRYLSYAYYEQEAVNTISENLASMENLQQTTFNCATSCAALTTDANEGMYCKQACMTKCKNSPSCAASFDMGKTQNVECTSKIGIIPLNCKNVKYVNIKGKPSPYCCMD